MGNLHGREKGIGKYRPQVMLLGEVARVVWYDYQGFHSLLLILLRVSYPKLNTRGGAR